MYGDEGADTLGHVCAAEHPHLPHLQALGLGNIANLNGIPPSDSPRLSYGRMQEASAGKDSTTGHWELAGLRLEAPFPTYPRGFPEQVVGRFLRETGCGGILGNKAASGTEIIEELGYEHQESGRPIVYTSADSVFQIAAHKEVIPLSELYRLCRIARERVCAGDHAVGRVIARPFVGSPGNYSRISAERKDYTRTPDRQTVQEALQNGGVRTVAVGKIGDLFADIGFDSVHKTMSNEEGLRETIAQMRAAEEPTFVWTNLIDFDQEYGHRNDPAGFARSLEAFDRSLPEILDALPGDGHIIITADQGNDPTTPGTDHTREFVPVLFYSGAAPRDLGLRPSFNDHAATVAAYFDVDFETAGTPFFMR